MFSGLLQKAAAGKRPHAASMAASTFRTRLPIQVCSVPLRFKSDAAGGTRLGSSIGSDMLELGAQLERQSEIIKNIKSSKSTIVKKQRFGRQLALNISDPKLSLEQLSLRRVQKHQQGERNESNQTERFEREQRYHMFIEKMLQLYKREKRVKRKRMQAYRRMDVATVSTMTPLKTCLSEYSALTTTSGFDCEVLAESLKRLNQTVAAIGNKPLTFNDYTLSQLDQSWRMEKVADDIEYGLDPNPNVFFSPHNLAIVSRELGTLGYKNTNLISRWFDKIESILADHSPEAYMEGAKVDFGQAMFGGLKGFVPRHYIYQGWASSDEFQQCVETLHDYQVSKQMEMSKRVGKGASGEALEIKKAAELLIDATKEVKDMQYDLEAAVRNVRSQYQKLMAAHDEHAFLQEHRYIGLDLLELQELLIKAGMLQPDEKVVSDTLQVGAMGMDAAVEVFHNLVINQFPDVLSPQYEQFYEAAHPDSDSKNQRKARKDEYAKFDLRTYSSTLVGLEKQTLSYRRDAVDNEHPSEFYEKLMQPEDKWLEKHEDSVEHDLKLMAYNSLPEMVRMERTHLNGWTTFMDRTQHVPEHMEKMLAKSNVTKGDCLSALRALNVTKFEARELRNKLANRYFANDTKRETPLQTLVDGAMGLAGCTYKPLRSDKMLTSIVARLEERERNGEKRLDQLTFLQLIELLKAFSTPGVARDDVAFVRCVKRLCQRLELVQFDIIQNELKFDELEILFDAYTNLKYSEVDRMRQIQKHFFRNESLRNALEQHELTRIQYQENSAAKYDPLKPRVVGGLTESLVKAELQNLHMMQANEVAGLNKDLFPYSPDLLMGYQGNKVGVFVLNTDSVMRDTKRPCGFAQGKMRLCESAHKLADKAGTSMIKPVGLAVSSVVDADLKNHKLSLRSDFKIGRFLDEIVAQAQAKEQLSAKIDTECLFEFSKKLTDMAADNADNTTAAFEEFLGQLLSVLRKREKMDSFFEQEQVTSSIDDLKLHLLKTLMMYEGGLTTLERSFIDKSLPSRFSSFKDMVTKGLVQPLNLAKAVISHQTDQGGEETRFWQGTRQEVEMPYANVKAQAPKSIVPELINHKFMWTPKYHHYADWESKMKEAYDQFNLMELPSDSKDKPSLYFNALDFKRRVPKGIFPDARRPRTVLQLPGAQFEIDRQVDQSYSDEMTRFERSPIRTMLKTELARNAEMAAMTLSNEVRTITNLQNIKQSLKSDIDDDTLCDYLFNRLSFTDKLIEAHLGGSEKQTGSAKYVKRDAASFRDFIDSQLQQGDNVVSPYDHFFMREANKMGNPQEIAEEIIALDRVHPKLSQDEIDTKKEVLNKRLEDLLINYNRTNVDKFNLSGAMGNSLEINIDLSQLTPVQNRDNAGLEPTELEMQADRFLAKQRARAEANLIKARISYKVHSDVPLSKAEKKYLAAWMEASQQTSTLLNNADVMVPAQPSKLSLAEALAPEDFYLLNTLARVDVSGSQKDQIALNDLVLELSHFVDAETVRVIELSFLETGLKKEWELADDFVLVERRNKEIDLVMKENEELTWRAAAQFDEAEKQTLEEIVFFDRGLDAFDNAFLGMDKESFSRFFDEANSFDHRTVLLENWLCRKDEEVRTRVNLPPPHMAKTDQELHAVYDKPLKQARESLLGKMLTTDEFGQPTTPKGYRELTTRELHLLVESLCVRLNLFQRKYPAFLPQVIKALQEHKNLANSDRSVLDTYCRLFELDWRGDHAVENREQFLMSNPIYMHPRDRAGLHDASAEGPLTNERVLAQIRHACQPYLPTLVSKMRETASKK